ncbi:hypothetical protein [Gilvimarinus agarilyticus]|uniref:hypothetical protein n=1 Tax=Gilvimarinus agarilyticus TaxID=679259 RepID=UPI0005A15D3F|nr:hypothetical protein [Gilvimarinus agarilyticus]
MDSNSGTELEAVIVFADGRIDRQLQYPEFEAVMDGFVPMQEFAGCRAQAVYVRINAHLRITTCVFFYVDFDPKGLIVKRWNVPFQQLANAASRGPDLGAGPIALACYSQCPIAWQKNNLWDPIMEPGRNSFVLMKKAVANNTLGLIFPEPDPEPEGLNTGGMATELAASELKAALEREYAQAMRTRLAHTLKEQRLHINTVRSRMNLKIDELKRDHQERIAEYQQALETQSQNISRLENDNTQLQQQLAMQESRLNGLREYYQHKLNSAQLDEASQVRELEAEFDKRLETALNEAREELQERLDMREIELYYRQQQEAAVREELELLRTEHENLLEQGATQIMTPLQKAGISFVVFAPGVGQTTLPAASVAEYVANPEAYIAKLCGLTEHHYRLWLDHSKSPYCTANNSDGEECGVGVTRVPQPSDFHDGESNRCAEHRSIKSTLSLQRG